MPTTAPAPACVARPRTGIDLLRCPSRTGFRNVYEHDVTPTGVWYVAKVKTGGKLRVLPGGRSRQPHVCAAAVVAWYEARYGPGWPAALKARKKAGWRVWRSASRGGYLACVWLWGKREEVRPVSKGGAVSRAAEPVAFATRAEARRACDVYARLRVGLLWPAATWRS